MCSKTFIRNIAFVLLLCFHSALFAQHYNFSNYGLKDGLPQSQVNVIFQAQDRTLWMGTYGGISNFDGKVFTSYGKAEGLFSNTVLSIAEDQEQHIFVGTEGGINQIWKGKVSKLQKSAAVTCLKRDVTGQIWGICQSRLFKLENNKQVFVSIHNKPVTTLSTDPGGNLYAAVLGTGIYKLERSSWVLYRTLPEELRQVALVDLLFDRKNPFRLFMLGRRKGIYVFEKDGIKPFFNSKNRLLYFSIAQDEKGRIWVGTDRGAYLADGQEIIHFTAENGLSSSRIHAVFKDAEDIMWLSSWTNGVFKYEGDTFTRYNHFKGKALNYAVSGLAEDKKGNLWIGTFGKGLLRFNGKEVTHTHVPALRDKDIYFICADRSGRIWFSVQDGGIWQYNGKTFMQILKARQQVYSAIMEDPDLGFWVAEASSVWYIRGNKKIKIGGFEGEATCLYALDKGRVLLGTTSGLYLIRNYQIDPNFKIGALKDVYILSIIKHENRILLGSLGEGLITWDVQTQAIKKYRIADGLNSNDVYSQALDDYNHLWIGTGRGINNLIFDPVSEKYVVSGNTSMIFECDEHAILNYKGSILVGTLNGLIRCKTHLPGAAIKRPSVNIQQINIYNKKYRQKDISIFPLAGKGGTFGLSHNQNHLSINFKGVYLTNPQGLTYRYRLKGLDNKFSKAISSSAVEYSEISPGKYTFQVFALANGQKSDVAEYSFTMLTPFYHTLWFRTLGAIAILVLVWFVFHLVFKSKERKRRQLEKIKLKEQQKIRQQTAEDFHDDIGNKLTRIQVLSEILDKKIGAEQASEKNLIHLIRENAGLLYTDTKEILWALDPKSDNLFAILIHIKNFGIDLFQDTGISFKMDGILKGYEKLHLSMEFNRNLTLIFKEMLNNILKHASAENVLISVLKTPENSIEILVADDGCGFDPKAIAKGRGLKNIQNRCKRIKSGFHLVSKPGKGTTATISTRISVS